MAFSLDSLTKIDKIIAGLVAAIIGYFIIHFAYTKMVMKESFAASVCKTPPPALLDYIGTNYPYYDEGSVFRPLDTLEDSRTQFVDFERSAKPSLYT